MNRNHVVVVAGLLVLILFTSGCATQPARETITATPVVTLTPTKEVLPDSKGSLISTEWILISFNNGRVSALNVVPGTKISAKFNPNGYLTGSSGCNNYTAKYEAGPKGVISITRPETTSLKCANPPGVMNQETQYLAMLGGISTFNIKGDLLMLLDGNGYTLATFSRG